MKPIHLNMRELTSSRLQQESVDDCYSRISHEKPLLNQRQRQSHLTSAKDKKDWTVVGRCKKSPLFS